MENRHSGGYSNANGPRRPRPSVDGFTNYSSRPDLGRGYGRPIANNGSQAREPEVVRPRPITQSAPARPAVSAAASGPRPVQNPITARDMQLPAAAVPGKRRVRRHHAKRPHGFRRWSLRLAAGLAVLILLGGGFMFSRGYLQLHKVFTGGSTAAALNSDVDPSALKSEGSGRVNILLMGIGGGNHDGPDLTDSIMVISIDVVNHKMDLLSLPRDLWVKEPNNYIEDYGKVNAAYESGKYKYLGGEDASNSNIDAIKAGFSAVDSTLSNVIGIPISYNVLVNFQAFQQAVDAVGGITVDVPTELYDPTMAWQNKWNPVLAEPGVQQMDGYQALLYARSRETTSDFARADRQRSILEALKDKVLTAGTLSNPLKIASLMDTLGDNVRTDISLGDMGQLYNIIKGIKSSSISSVDLDSPTNSLVTTGSLDGQSIVEPKAGLFDYSQIQSFVRNTLRDGYLAKENALVEVVNGTDIPGLATNVTNTLQSYGYRVAAPANAPTQGYQTTVLVDLTNGRDKYTKHYLENRFSVSATSQLPPGISANGANFVIILGQDEAENG